MTVLATAARAIGSVVGAVTGVRSIFGGGNRSNGPAPTPTAPSPSPTDTTQSTSRGPGMGATRYNMLSGGAQGYTDEPNLGRFRLLGR